MKINKNIFSMPLFALSFILLLFSCNQPSGTGTPGNGNPDETQKKYPETISTEFVKLSPEEMDFSSLTGYIAAIKNLLQPEEALTPEGYREFLSSLQEGLAKIIPQDQDFPYTLPTNEYAGKTPSDIEEKQTSTGYDNEEYKNLYQTFEESLTALNTAYPSYETSYNDYKSAYENTPQTGNFGSVKELLKKVIKDFNDDFYFEKETLESTELSPTIEECIKEQTELKTKLQSYWDNESLFIYSQEKFQQALSALRAYTPEEGTTVINIKDYISDSGDVNEVKTKVSALTGNISLNIKNTGDEGVYFYDIITLYKALKENENINEDIKIIYPEPSNTTITGALTFDLLKDPNISQSDVFKLFFGSDNITETDGKVNVISDIDLNRLPKVNVQFMGDENVNVYGLGIDKLITTYYDIGADIGSDEANHIRFQSYGSAHYFDAKEALNGQTMYTGNEYNYNAYNLDINAALLIGGGGIKNVNIIGTNKTNKTEMSSVTNVRVSSDVSDITFGAGSGVIDFVNTAPIQTPNLADRGKLILRSPIGNEFSINSAESLDLRYITKEDLLKGGAQIHGGYSEVHFKDTDSYNAVRFVNSPEVIYVNNQLKSGDNSRGFNATNADWEQAGNEGTLPPRNTANVSQANVKSVKSLVMKRLLDDNQRIYG